MEGRPSPRGRTELGDRRSLIRRWAFRCALAGAGWLGAGWLGAGGVGMAEVGMADAEANRSYEARFATRLQQRQLVRLAEDYCRQQLRRADLADATRAELIEQLLRAVATQAMDERTLTDVRAWERAEAIPAEFAETLRDPLARIRITFQAQLVTLARGTWLASTAALDPDPPARRTEAAGLLRNVTRALEDLDQQLEHSLRQPPLSDEPATRRAGERLRHQVRYKLGDAFLQHALCYSRGTPDQIHLLTRALEQFAAIARLQPPSDLTLESRLREVECHRRLGNEAPAQQGLAQFDDEPLDEGFLRRRNVEAAELQIDQGHPELAIESLLAEEKQPRGDVAPDVQAALHFGLIRAYLARAEQTRRGDASDEATAWETLALEQLQILERSLSPYWVRRAEAMLAGHAKTPAASAGPEVLARTAANFYRRGQIPDAVVAFQRAADLAEESENAAAAVPYRLQAAALLHQSGQHAAALSAFQAVIRADPNGPRAAQASWLAIVNAAQLTREQSDFAPQYDQLLQNHLQQWPDDPTTNQVRLWTGRLRQQQADLPAAIAIWKAIPPDFAEWPIVQSSIRAAYVRQLTDPRTAPSSVERLAREGIDYFMQSVPRAIHPDSSPSPSVCDAALTASEFSLCFTNATSEQALGPLRLPGVGSECEQRFPDRKRAWKAWSPRSPTNPRIGSRRSAGSKSTWQFPYSIDSIAPSRPNRSGLASPKLWRPKLWRPKRRRPKLWRPKRRRNGLDS